LKKIIENIKEKNKIKWYYNIFEDFYNFILINRAIF
jgi:hypothetical protein